ncbi:MAG: protein kinase [Polyangiales bacterium]|nr:protein kinase [Myxococcales bacterium]MCB9662190.1 protein kinase [Sandaracinaceae bacterium]
MASDNPTRRGLTREDLAETLALPATGMFEPDATIRPVGLRRSDRPVAGPRHKSKRVPFEGTGATLRLTEPLAEGGMGIISLGEQGALRREVAVKTLKPELRDPDSIDRLLTEARITGVVEHPNIVPIYALQADDEGTPLMVMKRIHGVSWRAMLRNDNHPGFPAEAQDRLAWHLRVLMDVCDAVHYAHSRGILHLDLKPDNVMIGGFRDVYLVDWGVAVSTRDHHRGWLPMADEVAEVVGTPSYMAPEMVDRRSSVLDERTDVYLLGAVLHEILTGRPPHQGGSVRDVLYAAYEARAPRFGPEVPAELAAIAARALEPRAELRFDSAEAFRSAVAAFLEHRTSAALADDAKLTLSRLRVSVARDRLRQETFENARAPVDAAMQREVMREFVECRFGFSRALKEWPDNERARAGLVEALLLMAEHQLSRGDATAASATLREVETSDPDERALIEALEQKVAQRLERQARLERIGYDQDPKYGRRDRALFVLIVSFVLGVFPVGGFIGLRMGWYEYATWHSFAFTGGLAATLIIGGALFRRRMMPNRAGRRFVVAMVVLCLLTLLNRVVALTLGHTEFRDVALDVFLFGTGAAMVGTLTDRRFLALAVAFTTCGLLIAMFPAYGMLLIGLAAWLGPGWTAWSWLRSAAREDDADDLPRRGNPSEYPAARNSRRP